MERTALKIELLLEEVIKFDASDLHIQVGLPPMLRVDGSLKPVEDLPVLEAPEVEKLIFSILDDDQKEILLKDTVGGLLWIALFDLVHHRGQLSAYIRPMGGKVPSIYGPSADAAGERH